MNKPKVALSHLGLLVTEANRGALGRKPTRVLGLELRRAGLVLEFRRAGLALEFRRPDLAEILLPTGKGMMRQWRKKLFVLLSRAARPATGYFELPSRQVIELGIQMEL